MTQLMSNPVALAVALAAFVAVLLLLEAAFLLWRQRFGQNARRLQSRLQALSGERTASKLSLLRQRTSAGQGMQGWLERQAWVRRLDLLLAQADLAWNPALTVLGSAAVALLAPLLLAGLLRQALLNAVLLGLLLAALPWGRVLWRRQQRLRRMEHQLPEALDLMVRALRAGHAFSSSLQMVADEMPQPIASEFRAVHEEVNFGLSLPQAFANLIERAPLTDLRYFVVAVLIQREAGGNLTELLANLSSLIRARLKLLDRVRVLSSEGRLSGLILVVLPFALGGLLSFFNPDFMRPLWTDPIGITILNWMLGLMVVGVLIMRKIIHIRV